MRLLWIATKSPWPPVDGGRLLVLHTLRALGERGHRIHLLVPEPLDLSRQPADLGPGVAVDSVPARRRNALVDLAAAYLAAEPWTVRRHRHAALGAAAACLGAAGSFDALVAEQLQAVAQLPPRPPALAPRILRAQNVESDLWRGAAALAGWRAPLLRREARRLEAAEGAAVRSVDCVAALTRPDAARLRTLAGGATRIEILAAPFPVLEDGRAELAGAPAVTLFGSSGWAPNRQAARWFVGDVWPRVLARCPGARLHVFGGERLRGAAIEWRPAPADSATAFARRAIFVVPLRVGSGVRMKILEAWARGVPVVSTPEGAAGLEAEAGRNLLLAADAEAMAAAIARLGADTALASALAAAGRDTLRRVHDPATVAAGWESLVASLAER